MAQPGGLKKRHDSEKLQNHRPNILLTNGRFPVSLDLARQFRRAGCKVYCVDPMKFHVCRFSISVTLSKHVPAPRNDAHGYVEGVKKAVRQWGIDYIIPIHEEEFYLAESKDPLILEKLYAPPWEVLLRLHSKQHYAQMVRQFGLDTPEMHVCSSIDDIRNLDRQKEWALKPIFGRASTDVHRLQPGEPIPDLNVSGDCQYVAQEWIHGNRYCSYSVFNHGSLRAHGVYPVLETIDGSSSVYFQACAHPKIKAYVEQLGEHLYPLHGQIGLDFVETEDRLVTIDCNPRATSGIHLWSKKPQLAWAFTNRLEEQWSDPLSTQKRGRTIRREVLPGMLMWEHKDANLQRYLKHLWRLLGARDIVWSWKDLMPSLASPFLLTYYYILCFRHNLELPDLFQWHVTWEPTAEALEKVRQLERETEGIETRDNDSAVEIIS